MSAKTRFELIAHVATTRGLKGKVTLKASADFPFCLYVGLAVHVVPPSLDGPRDMHVASIQKINDIEAIVGFQEVTSIEDAQMLVGRHLLADISDLNLDESVLAQPAKELLGRCLVDKRYGRLGKIVEVIQTPANDVWAVDGAYGKLLIPAIDSVIVELVKDSDEAITVHIPDGIVSDERT